MLHELVETATDDRAPTVLALEVIHMTYQKFSIAEVSAIREQLLQRIPDPFEIAEILQGFLVDHGFGVSSNTALDAASKIGASGCSFATVQTQLEAVALVM